MDTAKTPRHPVRVPPLPHGEWPAGSLAAVDALPGEMKPPPGASINVLDVLAHHPKLMSAILTFSNYFRFESTLDDRQRELLIIRIAWLRVAEYELLRHAKNARRYGFSEDDLIALAVGSTDPHWNEAESLLLRLVEELAEHHYVAEATWQALQQHYTLQQLMDSMFVVGNYDMFAGAYGTMGIQPEDNLPPYPVELPHHH